MKIGAGFSFAERGRRKEEEEKRKKKRGRRKEDTRPAVKIINSQLHSYVQQCTKVEIGSLNQLKPVLPVSLSSKPTFTLILTFPSHMARLRMTLAAFTPFHVAQAGQLTGINVCVSKTRPHT